MDTTSFIVTQDAESLTFAKHHQLIKVMDELLPELAQYAIVKSSIGVNGIYHIMHNADPQSFMDRTRSEFKFLKYDVDTETGKPVMYMADISSDEAEAMLHSMESIIWI